MDSITQMLFGAAVGQAGFRERLGRRALVAGAVIATIPDLDGVVGWSSGRFAEWEHHRGLTHSLFFGPAVGPVVGWIAFRLERWRRPDLAAEDGRLRAWIWLAMLALITHPLIDLFTSYGTQLLWPVARTRFAVDSMPIIEPIYSLALLLAVIVGARSRIRPAVARDVAGAALLFVGLYTAAGWALNEHVRAVAAADLGRPAEITAYPQLFQPVYRRVVALTPETAYVGYYSVLNPGPIAWRSYTRESSEAIDAVRRSREARIFEWFAMGKVLWRTVPDGRGGTRIEATDLRYGMAGATDAGQWGLRAELGGSDGSNGAVASIRAFTVPRDASAAAFRRYWAAISGR
jgi:inner membrane protein